MPEGVYEHWMSAAVEERMAALLAFHITTRFDQMMGEPLLCSPLVYLAAKQVLEVLFAGHNEEDVLRALREFLDLEQIGTAPQVPHAAPGGGGG